ncbi:MAG: DUF998 domain-containing protein [Actinophytocola sp.]|uniref:DUF998 domain-containing protein n=1 Tax=Actinophytocola sp. TaxID=1872138 RepID=UPI0013265D20|nr:DUF998 domain-containing protein [Actinophytocola sp.]MPZ79615.1 DUF998 domain-containing protein [Actinophytocola sp.]
MSSGRAVALASLGSLVAGVVLMLALHVLPPTNEISPVRRTLSQYALGPNKWIFDVAVLLVAIGSVLAFGVLVRQGVIRPLSGCTALGALWTLSLLVIVWFTKTDWTVGPSMGGTIHRYASVVGFVSLPLAVIVVARRAFPTSVGWRLAAQGFGLASLGSFGLILIGVVRMAGGGGPWWLFVPLGLVERAITVTAVAAITVVVLGVLVRAKSDDVVAVPA